LTESANNYTKEGKSSFALLQIRFLSLRILSSKTVFAADRIERECPNRRYVFERHPRKKLKLPLTDIKEVSASNRTDCEDRYAQAIQNYHYYAHRERPFHVI